METRTAAGPTAARATAVALAVGLAAELLVDGHAFGLNAVLGTLVLLAAIAAIAGGVRRLDPLDAWIPLGALVLATFVALRDDRPLVLLDLAGVAVLAAASGPAFAGFSVTRRSAVAISLLGARVAAAIAVGAVPLLGRVGRESDPGGMARDASRLAPVARGVLLGLPVIVLFAALFASADPIFGRWIDEVLLLDLWLGELPWRVAFTAFSAWLAGGLLWFVLEGRPSLEPRSLGAAASSPTAGAIRPWPWLRLGTVEAVTLLVLLDVLFAIFVLLQVAYLFGGADTRAAIGLTYAEYARRGFFELVTVVVLAGGLLMALEAVVAVRTRPYVATVLVLVGLTGVVLASSWMRLRLYQEAYGWTELRLYVLAAIVFLAFDLLAAGLLILRNAARWLPHAVVASALVVLVGVNVGGPQATVTARNLERALVPSLVPPYGETALDAAYLGSLDADAIPALVEALPSLDGQSERVRADLRAAWRRYVVEADESWQGWNLARARAREALVGLFGPPPRAP